MKKTILAAALVFAASAAAFAGSDGGPIMEAEVLAPVSSADHGILVPIMLILILFTATL